MQKTLVLRMRIIHCMLGVFSVAMPLAATPVINPKDYRSPSGQFTLRIDPSDMYGRGTGNYRVSQNSAPVWQGTKPVTLCDGRITDEGLIAGFGYTHGVEGHSKDPTKGAGEFHIVIMKANGELLLDETLQRKESLFEHASPDPLANGLIIDPASDRFAVRVRDSDLNRRREAWWIYKLSSGKSINKLEVPTALPVLRAEPVVGTALILVHQWQYDVRNFRNAGARFALLDWSLREAWSLSWPKDYNIPRDKSAEERLNEKIWANGAILNTRTSNQFEVFSGAKSERVIFRVQQPSANAGKLIVEEIGRTKHIETRPTVAEFPTFPRGALMELGVFTLREDGPVVSSPIRDIHGFDFDERGRIGLIRREAKDRYTFVHLEANGTILREILLAIPAKFSTNDYPKAAWLEGDRWAIVISELGVGGRAAAWWLNTMSGEFTIIPGLSSPYISKITGSRDGGFVALVEHHLKYTMERAIVAYDKAAKPRWHVKQDYRSDAMALFSPADVTVTTGGQIVLIDNKALEFLSAKGTFLTPLQLQKAWGRTPNYPSEITADKGGGFLVKDFQGTPPFVRMDSTGKVLSEFAPKHPNGRTIDVIRGIKVAPNGSVWVCDGECLIRLGDNGISDLVLGSGPAEERLGRIAALTVDQQGRLYAVDERTGAVHVYDNSGTRLRVCKPNVTDFKGKLGVSAHVAAAADGTVYLSDGDSFPDNMRFIHFAPAGERLGVKEFGLDSIVERWHPLPSAQRMLVLGYQEGFLVDRNGTVVRSIQRRPDRNWLENPREASIAPDGSFAIVTSEGYGSGRPWQVNLYTSEGEPVRTITMPAKCVPSCFAYTGRYLATRTETEICLFRADGEPLSKFSPKLAPFKDAAKRDWACFSTQSGKELWFVDADRKSVLRVEVPN